MSFVPELRGTRPRSPARALALTILGLGGLTAALVVLERLGVPTGVAVFLPVVATLALALGVGFSRRTDRLGGYFVAGRATTAAGNGVATAAAGLSSTAFFGLAGALYALDFDGLALVIGTAAGIGLIAILFAPYLQRSGAYSVAEFLAARFASRRVRVTAALCLLASCLPLLVAEIAVCGAIAERFLGLSFRTGAWGAAVLVLGASLVGGMRAISAAAIVQFAVLACAFVAPVLFISSSVTGDWTATLGYAQALAGIEDVRATLAAATPPLAVGTDPTPFGALGTGGFAALTASIAAGVAVLPSILGRSLMARTGRDARRAALWALVAVLPILLLAPAYAAFSKWVVLQNLVGQSIAELAVDGTSWIFEWGRRGLVSICGVEARTGAEILAACARIPGHPGVLRWSDLALDPFAVVGAAPDLFALPDAFRGLLAAGGLAASMAAAAALAGTLAAALGHDLLFRTLRPRATHSPRFAFARLTLILVLLGAAWTAVRIGTAWTMLPTIALNLAAGGLFPALVLAIWWRRATGPGAVAGMLAGLLATAVCLLVARAAEMPTGLGLAGLAEGLDLARLGGRVLLADSAAILGVPVGFVAAVLVSLATRPKPQALAFLDEIRRPTTRPVLNAADV